MRPRFANRGSHLLRLAVPALTSSCFNEAPIRESGKFLGPFVARERGGSFNEAPIRESGKCFDPVKGARPFLASMRPRFANRGSRALLPVR